MIKLLVTPVLREEGKMEGIIFSNEDRSLLILPKGLPYKTLMGTQSLLAHYEGCTPEGSMGFLGPLQAVRFVSEVVGDQVSIETADEMKERMKISEYPPVDGSWVDRLLMNTSRFNLSDEGNRARLALNTSPKSRYAKTDKGKQTQRKWRLSEAGQVNLQERRRRKREFNTNFKAAQTWLDQNPGKNFQDWLQLQDLQEA